MIITEVEIRLAEEVDSGNRLRGYASVVFDNCFVAANLRIIEGYGGLFVAMPSRKLMRPCERCGEKNHQRANFCNRCGHSLPGKATNLREGGKLHFDVCYPITHECREAITGAVLKAYHSEVSLAKDIAG